MFKELHPILGVRDVARSLEFYVERLGFKLAFRDPSGPDNYAGVRRDAVELHMQFQYEHEMSTTRLRFLVEDPDALFAEYTAKGVIPIGRQAADTPWQTREFAFYDPDGNALTFYRGLTKSEMS
jgi:catechol 2,3-dioxygenase-like lactoylglutathione lyase family enzyme